MKNSIKILSMLMLAMLVVFTSCKKDDDDDDTKPVIVLDGIYIKGAGTALTDFNTKGMFENTPNEVGQADRASLYEIYVAVKGGDAGFNIVMVAGATRTTYGPGSDFDEVPQGTTDEPKVPFWRGSFTETSTAFTVPADGLYHVIIDTELMKVVIVPVEYWGVIGAATPGGWSDDTKLMPEGFDLNSMNFKATEIEMTKADFKFRHSGGWKVEIDTTDASSDNWIKANTNYGGAVDNLVPGGANISNDVLGIYTVEMTWTLGEGYVATVTKTGDLETFDYSNTELGLVGDGLVVGGVQHNWDETVMLSLPVVENDDYYTWTWEGVEVTAAGSFKIREGQDWNGKVIGYNEVTMEGLAADKFETNNDGNFVPTEDGVYDFELYIDAITEEYTLTVNPAGEEAIYMLGDGTSAGWDNTNPITVTGTNGIFTITTDLPGGGYIKFITVIGQWQPQYGTDATGTSTGGPLVSSETLGSDPDAIPAPADAGTYTITANTVDWVYTIEPAK